MRARFSVLGCSALAAAILGLAAFAAPASAEIEKFMNQCDGKLCAFFRASITLPDGWVEDKEATRELGVQMLVPKGVDFEDAPAKIYVMVRYNARNKQQIADVTKDTYIDWQKRAKTAKTEKLANAPRDNGKPAFVSHRFAAASLKEQGYERVSIASDTDKDGNSFFVIVTLSANSPDAYANAEAAYNSILKSY